VITHCNYGYPLDAPRTIIAVLNGEIIAYEHCLNPFKANGDYDTSILAEFQHRVEQDKHVVYNNSDKIEWFVQCVPTELFEELHRSAICWCS